VKITKIPWILKVIILCIGTLTVGIIPALAIMWANYIFEPGACWTNIYGGWLILPMLVSCSFSGFLTLDYLERKMEVCNHGR
jgi:hypothetical protein